MKIKLILFAALFTLFSCGNDQVKSEGDATNTSNAATASTPPPAPAFTDYTGPFTADAIANLTDQIYDETNKKMNAEKAMHYVQACEGFAKANPTDPQSPEFILKAAEMARNINQNERALKLYDQVIADYPDFPKAAQALFLKAFTLDENLKKKEEAKAVYEDFLKKHPNDDFAESAKFMLENLYKSDAEIIKEFDEKRKE